MGFRLYKAFLAENGYFSVGPMMQSDRPRFSWCLTVPFSDPDEKIRDIHLHLKLLPGTRLSSNFKCVLRKKQPDKIN